MNQGPSRKRRLEEGEPSGKKIRLEVQQPSRVEGVQKYATKDADYFLVKLGKRSKNFKGDSYFATDDDFYNTADDATSSFAAQYGYEGPYVQREKKELSEAADAALQLHKLQAKKAKAYLEDLYGQAISPGEARYLVSKKGLQNMAIIEPDMLAEFKRQGVI
jgi:hypothetical protein